MYKITDIVRILAIGLAAAVVIAFQGKAAEPRQSVKNCLIFPQFTAAAAADRDSDTDDGEIVYAFRIKELFEDLFLGE